MKKRFIIAVPYSIKISGLIILSERLAESLIKKIYQVEICVVADTYLDSHIKVRLFENANSLVSWLENNYFHYDYLIWAGFFIGLDDVLLQLNCAILLREKYKKNVYFIWERTGFETVLPNTDYYRTLVKRSMDGVLILNEYQKIQLRRLGVGEFDIFNYKAGIDLSGKYQPTTIERKIVLRKSFGWDINKIFVLYMGRFTRRKRTDLVINAWLDDQIFCFNAKLILIGSGFNEIDSIEDKVINKTQNISSIEIIPYKSSIERYKYYQASDILLLPGVTEGEPQVLIEAMACGLPIIASDIPGHSRLVKKNHSGLLFKPENSHELIACLRLLIENEELRNKYGQNAHEAIVSSRNSDKILEELIEFFDKSL